MIPITGLAFVQLGMVHPVGTEVLREALILLLIEMACDTAASNVRLSRIFLIINKYL